MWLFNELLTRVYFVVSLSIIRLTFVYLIFYFYVDDAIFLGEWKELNIRNIVRVLRCFFLASGLKININKSKLLGFGVPSMQVEDLASLIGCVTMKTHFHYLGLIVRRNMSQISSWKYIILKVVERLSKWTVKTVSVGGRLTLIKFVLGSLPNFFMSLYKAPIGILNSLEAMRNKFFIVANLDEKK